jgi:cytochrome c oxidase cbb3-type subunit II
MEFFNDHVKLFRAALVFYLVLTLFVVIIPAFHNEQINVLLPGAKPMSTDAQAGKLIFISYGCVGCHTQQVRDLDMDKQFGSRPSIAADYAGVHRTDFWRNTATLMGTERTGPDLTNIGVRQPLESWHLIHLFNPRIVVKESIMPAYSWLFNVQDAAKKGEVVISVPDSFMDGETGKVVASKEALQLVAYLQSLKQVDLPDGRPVPAFLYPAKRSSTGGNNQPIAPDGGALYASNCQSCHQPDGQGLKGAFPPLKGSSIVNNDDPEEHLSIILTGYTGRIKEGYGPMPAIGTNNHLSAAEITEIMNYERGSWGNAGKKVELAAIDKMMMAIKPNSNEK